MNEIHDILVIPRSGASVSRIEVRSEDPGLRDALTRAAADYAKSSDAEITIIGGNIVPTSIDGVDVRPASRIDRLFSRGVISNREYEQLRNREDHQE